MREAVSPPAAPCWREATSPFIFSGHFLVRLALLRELLLSSPFAPRVFVFKSPPLKSAEVHSRRDKWRICPTEVRPTLARGTTRARGSAPYKNSASWLQSSFEQSPQKVRDVHAEAAALVAHFARLPPERWLNRCERMLRRFLMIHECREHACSGGARARGSPRERKCSEEGRADPPAVSSRSKWDASHARAVS